MVPQPQLEVPAGHTKSYRNPSVLLLVPGSLGPRGSGAHQPAPRTPALTSSPSLHLSAIPGGWSTVPAAQCRVPCLPALCHAGCSTSTSVLQSTVRASWAERRRHQERCDWWGGHIPAPGLPLPPGTAGLCQASRSPLPSHCVAGLLVEDTGPRAGWAGGRGSSCWLPAPPVSLNPLAPTRAAAPRCFPRSS